MCGVMVIVTRWWLTWLLVTVACVMCLLGANLSPSWLLGPLPNATRSPASSLALITKSEGITDMVLSNQSTSLQNLQAPFSSPSSAYRSQGRPSLGIWIRCFMGGINKNRLHCGVYATSGMGLPTAQIVALVAVVSATVLTSVSCLAILSSTCVRIVKGANWFSIIGAMQALAGVLSIVGVAVFPLAWNSDRVKVLCGSEADMYYPKSCSIGWAVYVTLLGSIGLLLCSWMSSVVAYSTASEQVSDEIAKGKKLVCLI